MIVNRNRKKIKIFFNLVSKKFRHSKSIGWRMRLFGLKCVCKRRDIGLSVERLVVFSEVAAKGGDKRGQDVARQTMDLNSGVTNPKMERNGEATRPPMEHNAQVGLKTDNKK